MSADNWAVCPRCEAARQAMLAARRVTVDAMYGKASVAEFDAAREELAAMEAKPPGHTFREDYEFYGVEEGTLYISYSGGCKTCGLTFTHKSEHPLPV
jgi:hypothetical protein